MTTAYDPKEQQEISMFGATGSLVIAAGDVRTGVVACHGRAAGDSVAAPVDGTARVRCAGVVASFAVFCALALFMVWSGGAVAAAERRPIPAAVQDNPKVAGSLQTAVVAGGCFWGVQGVFEHVKGVRKVLSGYSGGKPDTAQYGRVSAGTTGHAESVQITFDPQVVSYGELLRVYFSVAHNPTELNRQGPDSGPQYRSAIFYSDASQQRIAQAYIAQLGRARVFSRPIVTRVDPLTGFFAAEGYHQDYLVHNPNQPYIAINDLPKIEALKRQFPDWYLPNPVLVSRAP